MIMILKLMMKQIKQNHLFYQTANYPLNKNCREDVKQNHTYALGTSQTEGVQTGCVRVRFTGGTELFWVSSTFFHQAVPCNHKQLFTVWHLGY